MPTFNSNATLDGVTPFTIETFPVFSWGGAFIRNVDLSDFNAANIHDINLSLSNSWTIREMAFRGSAVFDVSLTDLDSNTSRRIDWLRYEGLGTLTVDFLTTRARLIELNNGAFDIDLGSGFFESISMQNSISNTIGNAAGGTIRSLTISGPTSPIDNDIDIGGRANQIRINRGDNDIDVTGVGRIDSLTVNDATTSAITIDAGARIDYARLNGIYDPVTDSFSARIDNDIEVQGRIDYLHIWAGENDLEVGVGGRIRSLVMEESLNTLVVADDALVESIRTWRGNTTITLEGSGRVQSMKLDEGTHTVTTGSRWLESYHSYLSTDTLNIGTGGANSIMFEQSVGPQSLTAAGFVNSVRLNGNNTATMTFNGGIGNLLAFGGTTYTINIGAGTNTGYNGTIQAFATTSTVVNTGAGSVAAIFTGAGADVITTGTGFVQGIDTDAGNDRVTLGAGGAGVVTGGAGDDTLTGSGIEDALYGGADNDSLTGGAANDSLYGGLGTDRAEGGTGDDLIEGGAGADTLYGDDGLDTLLGGSSGDLMYGGLGEDLLDGGSSADTIHGGDGADSILGGTSGDSLFGGNQNDTIFGGTSDDTISGGGHSDLIHGDDGNDSLLGDGSADTINGGLGDDVIDGGSSGDVLNGEAGADSILGGSSADLINGGTENDTIRAGTGDDTVSGGSHSDLIHGDDGNDSLMGDGSADTIFGGAGTDFIDGGSSADVLYGGSSADTIIGGSGSDTIFGGSSGDVMTGGTGNDVFVFDTGIGSAIDTITDFNVTDDTIRLDDSIFAGLSLGALAAGAFVANAAGAATLASHRIIYDTDSGALSFDADGNGAGASVQFATLSAGLAMTAADFVVI